MTRRDLKWRLLGLAIVVGSYAAARVETAGSPRNVVWFVSAIIGVVLLLNGKRVAVALRAERRGHADTASSIHAARVRRRDRGDGLG